VYRRHWRYSGHSGRFGVLLATHDPGLPREYLSRPLTTSNTLFGIHPDSGTTRSSRFAMVLEPVEPKGTSSFLFNKNRRLAFRTSPEVSSLTT
jgi:hypothetical protein